MINWHMHTNILFINADIIVCKACGYFVDKVPPLEAGSNMADVDEKLTTRTRTYGIFLYRKRRARKFFRRFCGYTVVMLRVDYPVLKTSGAFLGISLQCLDSLKVAD